MTMINNPIEVMFSELVEFNYLEILELITKKKKIDLMIVQSDWEHMGNSINQCTYIIATLIFYRGM